MDGTSQLPRRRRRGPRRRCRLARASASCTTAASCLCQSISTIRLKCFFRGRCGGRRSCGRGRARPIAVLVRSSFFGRHLQRVLDHLGVGHPLKLVLARVDPAGVMTATATSSRRDDAPPPRPAAFPSRSIADSFRCPGRWRRSVFVDQLYFMSDFTVVQSSPGRSRRHPRQRGQVSARSSR